MEGIREAMERINTRISEQRLKTQKIKCAGCGNETEVTEEKFFNELKYELYFCNEKCREAYKEKQLKEYYEKHGKYLVPKKFIDLEFRDKELVKKLINRSVFITGKTGIGKTVLMASLVKNYTKLGYGYYPNKKIQWISFPAFIMELQSLFRQDKENPFTHTTEIARFDGILAIDDLGAEKLTDYVRQITYFIINEREQRELPILITSNFSLNEIDRLIDSRISSRIAGICEVIKLSGKDKRLKENR